jgi:predicted AAA+ superfamily ATPase
LLQYRHINGEDDSTSGLAFRKAAFEEYLLYGGFSFGSQHTAEKYVAYLRQAYLLPGIRKFSFKAKERICNEKNYAVDTGFISLDKEDFSMKNTGQRLENIVCVELLRRKNQTLNDVYYYKNGYEIDFVLSADGKVVELIQVSADISTAKTFNRETNALLCASAELHCKNLTLITLNENRTYSANNLIINIVSALNWMSL